MDADLILALVFRWMHILAAIAAVGGVIFFRFALLPASETLNQEQRLTLLAALRSRWAMIVHLCIAALVVSGIVNFLLLNSASKTWPGGLPKPYHMVFGIKVLLALGMFFISSALAGRSPALEKVRANARFWLTVNLILALLIVGLSGVLRMTHVGPNITAESKES